MKTHYVVRSFIAAAVCLLAVPGSRAASINLLRDPDFKLGLEGGPWRFRPGGAAAGKASVSFRPDPDRPGTSLLEIARWAPGDTGLVQDVPVSPSRIYKISGRVRTQGVGVSGGAPGKTLGASLSIEASPIRSADLRGTRPWTPLEIYVRTGPAQTVLPLECRLGRGASGTAWFDDLRVEEADSSAPEAGTHVHDLAVLAVNPGFEYGETGFIEGWMARVYRPAEAFIGIDEREKRSGRASAVIASRVYNDAQLIQDVPVQPNRIYRISGWIKTEGVEGLEGLKRENIGAHLCLSETWAPWIRSADLKGTRPWTRVEIVIQTGYDASSIPLACRLGFPGNTVKGTAWFDDLMVEEVRPRLFRNAPVYGKKSPLLFAHAALLAACAAGAYWLLSALLALKALLSRRPR